MGRQPAEYQEGWSDADGIPDRSIHSFSSQAGPVLSTARRTHVPSDSFEGRLYFPTGDASMAKPLRLSIDIVVFTSSFDGGAVPESASLLLLGSDPRS
jgi:hypothetical protein